MVTHILHQRPVSCPSGLALSLQQAAEKACLWSQVFIKGKWVMMMDCVLAACLESLTPKNDPKYWDLCVVLSYFIPPRMLYEKALIQKEEPFQKYSPRLSVQLFHCCNCLYVALLHDEIHRKSK